MPPCPIVQLTGAVPPPDGRDLLHLVRGVARIGGGTVRLSVHCAGGEALVATGPRDPTAAGATGRGRIRASDADREQVIERARRSRRGPMRS
jgi:hypothetical protein